MKRGAFPALKGKASTLQNCVEHDAGSSLEQMIGWVESIPRRRLLTVPQTQWALRMTANHATRQLF